MHGTTRTITWCWGASMVLQLPRTRNISGNAKISPSSRQRPRTVSTACLQRSGRELPIHLGGNTYSKRGYLRKLASYKHHKSRALIRQIKASIQEDWCLRVVEAGSTVDSLLTSDPSLIREAWIWMGGWYKDVVGSPSPPSRMAIVTMSVDQVRPYQHVTTPGQLIPVGVQPLLMEESVPEDGDVACAVCRLCRNRSGSLSGMRAKNLYQWFITVTQDNTPDASNWPKVVPIVQSAFHDGTLSKESTWQTVILITKGASGNFRVIGLV